MSPPISDAALLILSLISRLDVLLTAEKFPTPGTSLVFSLSICPKEGSAS
jgi:hypothetical protein